MEVSCNYCGKIINRKPSQALKYKNTFCSAKCRYLGMTNINHAGQFKPLYKHINSEGLLLCTCCGKYLDKDLFYKRSDLDHRLQRDYFCKECEMTRSKHDYINKRPAKIRYLSTEDGFLKTLVQTSKNRNRSKLAGLERNIDFEYIKKLYNDQNGLCNISGEKMTMIIGEGNVPTNVSLDRIDSNIGYIKGNVQLVCRIVNTIKSTLTMDELHEWCTKILKHKNNE